MSLKSCQVYSVSCIFSKLVLLNEQRELNHSGSYFYQNYVTFLSLFPNYLQIFLVPSKTPVIGRPLH